MGRVWRLTQPRCAHSSRMGRLSTATPSRPSCAVGAASETLEVAGARWQFTIGARASPSLTVRLLGQAVGGRGGLIFLSSIARSC